MLVVRRESLDLSPKFERCFVYLSTRQAIRTSNATHPPAINSRAATLKTYHHHLNNHQDVCARLPQRLLRFRRHRQHLATRPHHLGSKVSEALRGLGLPFGYLPVLLCLPGHD